MVSTFGLPFRDLLGLAAAATAQHYDDSQQQRHAAWRALPLTKQPLRTGLGFSQSDGNITVPPSRIFFTTAGAISQDDEHDDNDGEGDSNCGVQDESSGGGGHTDLLTQFCEQSLAYHTSANSLLVSDADDDDDDTETSFMSTTYVFPGEEEEKEKKKLVAPAHPPALVGKHLSDLEDVPPARQVKALHPQTITLNIIAGILSVAQPRTITTRWGSALSLVEVLVGDETATGFAVTFWVPREKPTVIESHVLQLRRQDVVLMENVALHVFRDKVYGQSLRRGLTRVHLLWRADGTGLYSSRALRSRRRAEGSSDSGVGSDPQRDKTVRAKDWVLRFVGRDSKAVKNTWDEPPEDTQ